MTKSPPGIHTMSEWGGSVAGTATSPGADLAVASIDELMLRLLVMCRTVAHPVSRSCARATAGSARTRVSPSPGATRRVARGEKSTARETLTPLLGCAAFDGRHPRAQ